MYPAHKHIAVAAVYDRRPVGAGTVPLQRAGDGHRPPLQKQARVELMPISPAQLAALKAAAAADDHEVVHPTHVAVRPDGQIIGYASLAAVPLFFAWMDSKHATARESFAMWQAAEEVLVKQGHREVCMPCTDVSPFHPFLARRGYADLGTSQFTIKKFGQPEGKI